MKDDFFTVVWLFICLIFAVVGVGASVYGICIVTEWWIRLLCWFGSIVSLVGVGLIVWLIKTLYFDEE